jgi:hypothetical protein
VHKIRERNVFGWLRKQKTVGPRVSTDALRFETAEEALMHAKLWLDCPWTDGSILPGIVDSATFAPIGWLAMVRVASDGVEHRTLLCVVVGDEHSEQSLVGNLVAVMLGPEVPIGDHPRSAIVVAKLEHEYDRDKGWCIEKAFQ